MKSSVACFLKNFELAFFGKVEGVFHAVVAEVGAFGEELVVPAQLGPAEEGPLEIAADFFENFAQRFVFDEITAQIDSKPYELVKAVRV